MEASSPQFHSRGVGKCVLEQQTPLICSINNPKIFVCSKASNLEEAMTHDPIHSTTSGKRLWTAIVLNASICLVEIAGGILTNSLALVSDAIHNLSDVLALVLSYVASKVVLWESNPQKSYGYVRVEIFVAFINALTLVAIGGYIIYEGIRRFFSPEPVLGAWMIIVAAVGLAANAISTILLRKDAHRDLNTKSAYLHLLTDAIESLAVVVVGIAITWKGWYILDPLISAGIGIFVMKSAWDMLSETVNILTEGTPKGVDLDEVARFIRSFPGILNVHHVHIWSLSSQFRALSAHLVVADSSISEARVITDKLEEGLLKKFDINHPTLQLESEVCKEQGTLVDLHHPHPGS
jgi:cobalt-zinc-cadmium efflux system protein